MCYPSHAVGDETHEWPAKEFSHAVGGTLCALAVRLTYAGYSSKAAVFSPSPYAPAKCTGEAVQVSLSAEGRSHRASGGRCAFATDPTHGEMGLSDHDPALRFVNEAAVGLCFHATRWHVVTGCGVGSEEVLLEGMHYETWLGLVWGRQFRPVLLPSTCANRMSWAGITLRHDTSCT